MDIEAPLWSCSHGTVYLPESIRAALERAEEQEHRIGDKNFELAGVHEALRKETERAERVEKAGQRFLDADAAWAPGTLRDMAEFDKACDEYEAAREALRAALEGRDG